MKIDDLLKQAFIKARNGVYITPLIYKTKDQLKQQISDALPEKRKHKDWCFFANVKGSDLPCNCSAQGWNAYKREAEKRIEELFG